MSTGPITTEQTALSTSNNMFLSDVDIKKAVVSGAIIIEPFDERKLQLASYDVSLGNEFEIVDRHQLEASDPAKKSFQQPERFILRTVRDSFFIRAKMFWESKKNSLGSI